MRININLSEKLLNEIDRRAKSLNLARSAYIAMALSYKMQQDDLIEKLPELVGAAKKIQEESEKLREERQKLAEEKGEK